MKKAQDYLKIKEAAEVLNVTTQTLRNWEWQGKFIAHRHPMNNYRLYKRKDLEDVLKVIRENKK